MAVKRISPIVGASMMLVTLIALASTYNCDDCIDDDSFITFGAKEVWATKSGPEIWNGVTVQVSG